MQSFLFSGTTLVSITKGVKIRDVNEKGLRMAWTLCRSKNVSKHKA